MFKVLRKLFWSWNFKEIIWCYLNKLSFRSFIALLCSPILADYYFNSLISSNSFSSFSIFLLNWKLLNCLFASCSVSPMFFSSSLCTSLSKLPVSCSKSSASYSNYCISSISFSRSRSPAWAVSLLLNSNTKQIYILNIYISLFIVFTYQIWASLVA